MNDNKSRDIFYGVVAVATLIVALVGATLAYFSISASSNEGAVSAKAAVVSINYNDTQQVTAQAQKLIPSELQIMQYYYEMALASGDFVESEGTHDVNKCQDAKDNEICSVYRFTVSVDSGEESIKATLNTEDNGFTYLAYAVREASCTPTMTVTSTGNESTDTSYETFSGTDYESYTSCWMKLDGNTKWIGLSKCSNSDEEAPNCFAIDENTNVKTYSPSNPVAKSSIFGYDAETKFNTQTITATPKAYDLVLFLKENSQNQNADQGKEYKGTLVVEVTGKEGNSGIITGRTTRD